MGRAHGIHGEVAVEARTDAPELRFAPGACLHTQPAERGPLVVRRCRHHHGRLIVGFDGVADRTAAEALAGTLLVIDSADAGDAGEDAWWDSQLVGLRAERPNGELVGEVVDVVHSGAQDVLVLRLAGGGEALVPFVTAIVPTVDVAAGRLVVDPPDGLLDL